MYERGNTPEATAQAQEEDLLELGKREAIHKVTAELSQK